MAEQGQIQKPKSAALQVRSWFDAPTMRASVGAALAGYMEPETFAAQCYLAAQDPKLASCSAESLFAAFLICAQMGLLPGSHHKHVALVPRGGVITVTPEWRGYKFLMEKQPGIRETGAVLVHGNDLFEYDDVNDCVGIHKWDRLGTRMFEHPEVAKKNNRECMLRGGYFWVDYEDVGRQRRFHVVPADKIHKNRRCAQTQDIWEKWFEEMCMKTVYRDAWSKRIVSIDPQLVKRLSRADEVDNEALGNDPSRVAVSIAARPVASRTAALAAKLVHAEVQTEQAEEATPDMSKVPVTQGAPQEPQP